MKRIAVFCGSSEGNGSVFMEHAYELGRVLSENNKAVVYGGAKVGLMGAVANGALDDKGEVIGIIPGFLSGKEIIHPDLSKTIITETMHERKMKMCELCDGVISLPGGFGTMDEMFEMLTWAQLGLHSSPIGLWNIQGYFNPLLKMVQSMVDNGFLKEINQDMLLVSEDLAELLEKMNNYIAPDVPKWLTKNKV